MSSAFSYPGGAIHRVAHEKSASWPIPRRAHCDEPALRRRTNRGAKESPMKPAIPILCLAILQNLLLAREAHAAWDPQDPLEGNRPLARSSEILALRADPVLTPRLYDANGDAAVGGIDGPTVLNPPTGYRGLGYDFDGVAADFDGDGKEEFAYVYEATDGYAYTRIVDVDDGVLGPALNGKATQVPVGGALHERQLRLVAGNRDADPTLELVLAHRSASGMRLETYDVDPATFALTLVNQVTWSNGTNCFSLPSAIPEPSLRFDIAVADVDGDEIDELVVAQITDSCNAPGIFATLISQIEVRVRGTSGWLPSQGGGDSVAMGTMVSYLDEFTDQRWDGVALAIADFDGGARMDQIGLVGLMNVEFGIGSDVRFVKGGFLEASSGTVTPFGAFGAEMGILDAYLSSVRDKRLDADAADFDLDGRAELVTLDGFHMGVWQTEADFALTLRRIQVFGGAGGGAYSEESGHGRLMVRDIDASDSAVYMPEIAVANAWIHRIYVYRMQPSPQGWGAALVGTPSLAHEHNSPVKLVPSDLDDDGIRLGAPQAQRRNQVFQPVVLLNTPPVHFDVLGGQVYDVNGCWDADACDHTATYENTVVLEGAVSTEVHSSWAVSEELRAGASVELGFVSASVETHLGSEAGQDLVNFGATTETFEKTFSLTAMEDDWLYGTKLDYWVVEYPIFAQGGSEPVTDVVAVVPIHNGPAWVSQRSETHLSVLQDHEHGNLLSYRKLYGGGNPMVDVSLPYTDAASQVPITTGTDFTWHVYFEQGQESEWTQASRQSVSAGVDAELSAGAFGVTGSIGASVEGEYGSESIRTHTTTATTSGSLEVTLSDHEPIGGSTYADYRVTPYLYWSYSGALVVDYEVDFPAATTQVPTFWDDAYGWAPDPAMSMPWRNDMAKYGQAVGEQPERTRDIVLTVLEEEPLDVMISARVQNYSFEPSMGGTLHFYRGDPRTGGEWIGAEPIDPIAPREDTLVELSGWAPATLDPLESIYVEIVPDDPQQIHAENDLAWNYAVIYLPEPGATLSLAVGIALLSVLPRRRRAERAA
jgi:hypothetical protein